MNSPETNGCIRNLLACQFEVRRLIKVNAELVLTLETIRTYVVDGADMAGMEWADAIDLLDKAIRHAGAL